MFVCRNLDYIVNGELHKSLDEKLTLARNSGVEVTIELVEPIDDIIIGAKDLIKMTERIIDDALVLLEGTENKKMIFCSFYKENDLWIIIKYNATTTRPLVDVNKELNRIINSKYKIISNISSIDSWITQELILFR